MLLTYLISRRLLGERILAILPALVIGLVIDAVIAHLERVAEPLSLKLPAVMLPAL